MKLLILWFAILLIAGAAYGGCKVAGDADDRAEGQLKDFKDN